MGRCLCSLLVHLVLEQVYVPRWLPSLRGDAPQACPRVWLIAYVELFDLGLVTINGEVLLVVVIDATHFVAQLGNLLDLAITAISITDRVTILDPTNTCDCIV